MISIVVCGAKGRMGRAVIECARLKPDAFTIASVVTRASNDQETWDYPRYDDCAEALAHEHDRDRDRESVVIDFSAANMAHHHMDTAMKFRAPLLLCTTGLDDRVHAHARVAAEIIPIMIAPNTSMMAPLMMALTKIAGASLPQTSTCILDIHHAEKKDAPSGTALALKNALAPKKPEINSFRQAQVIGEHTVYFFNDFERLEITHRVTDRRVFAEGALIAAQFLFDRGPGLYDMNDVLNLDLTIKNPS